MLASQFGLMKLSTGDLLRDAVRQGTPLGLEARGFMDAGELVPDSVILGLVREVMSRSGAYAREPGQPGGFIFDGFPRTVAQADGLATLMRELGQRLDAVLVLDVDDEELVRRLAGRISCPTCARVYNRYTDPPRVEGVCDACGSPLVQREDDKEETVRRRLEVYRQQTEPLIDWYKRDGAKLQHITGSRPVEEVQRELIARLKG
jgi:adenylate kinase